MRKELSDYAHYGAVGISWVLTSLLAVYLGYRGGLWLDTKLSTDPLFTLIGIIVAIVLSIVSLLQRLMEIEKAMRKAESEPDQGDSNRIK